MLLSFASFICGFSFMLLSVQLHGSHEIEISGLLQVISMCLYCVCIVLLALTMLGLLVVMPFKPYAYIGLAVLAVVALPVVLTHWYVSDRTAGKAPEPDAAAELKEQTKEMEDSFKITAAMAASSFAGLVGTLFGVYKQHPGSAGGATPCSVHVAFMFMFSTATVSLLLMMLSMKTLEVNNRDLRRLAVGVIRHANNVLLCLLGVAALSPAFVILRYYILAAFVSLAVAAIVHFVIQHCTTARRHEQGERSHNQETRLKWMADIGSKVTAYSLAGVMAIFGGFLEDSDSSADKMVAIKICMFLLTSALASGLGLMWLTTRPRGSGDGVGSNAATNILAWSALGLLAVATLAIYCAEVMKS